MQAFLDLKETIDKGDMDHFIKLITDSPIDDRRTILDYCIKNNKPTFLSHIFTYKDISMYDVSNASLSYAVVFGFEDVLVVLRQHGLKGY